MKYYTCPEADAGKTVLEILIQKGEVPPETPCGGKGSCGKCRMRLSGKLSPATDAEIALLGDLYQKGYRLTCLTQALGDFEYEEIAAKEAEIQLDFAQKENTEGKNGRFLAVDIGTTTVALYVVENGEVTEKKSFLNPQRVHGADVISRIVYATEGGRDKLKEEICSAIKENCHGEFDYAVVCGNTAIEHFLCGEDPAGIAKLPFTPASLFGEEYSFDFCKNTYVAPCIASYVGGDITLGVLAADLDKEEKTTLYIDIGTNGEIVLKKDGRMLCCAAAAGPAFEGGNIECGIAAMQGAIERVYLDGDTLGYETIGNTEPTGICGSGIIDAAAMLLRVELLDETGRLEEDKYYFNDNIYISQKDIRNLQSAKAAIAAGIRTLCSEMKCDVDDIEKVIIAGGFGTHINTQSALDIGLIPYDFEGEIVSLGNLAGLGAVTLCQKDEMQRLADICKSLEYIELSLHKKFNQYYIDEMFFEERI